MISALDANISFHELSNILTFVLPRVVFFCPYPVRRLVMQSFLDIKWEKIRKLSLLLPENVLLGPYLEALDDPVHHRDFGMSWMSFV